jgi:diaminohydroxyphosphoribosylaminopyrimidine deaminase/5-amino-6-(5-phosphoribosylamino)uracil reductase
MPDVLAACWDLGIQSVLCEGGGRLADTLLRERIAQRLYVFVAPLAFGSEGVAAFPPDADALSWDELDAVVPPQLLGRDTLMIFDRRGE